VTRRSLRRSRLAIVLGALITLAGTVPPWWMIGGTVTPLFSGNAFEGVGIVVFIVALALLALVVLPFASRDGGSAFDRPASYVALAALGVGALLARVVQIAEDGALGLPDRAPGLWLTAAGLAVVGWGVAAILVERPTDW
jgi:hypothetical protein